MAILEAGSPKKLMRSISCDTIGLTGSEVYGTRGSGRRQPSQVRWKKRGEGAPAAWLIRWATGRMIEVERVRKPSVAEKGSPMGRQRKRQMRRSWRWRGDDDERSQTFTARQKGSSPPGLQLAS